MSDHLQTIINELRGMRSDLAECPVQAITPQQIEDYCEAPTTDLRDLMDVVTFVMRRVENVTGEDCGLSRAWAWMYEYHVGKRDPKTGGLTREE